ncbi:radical SAM protein [Egibacter rhizosphaerae]|uniref:Radical SAM protein n=1 Tax=Egibacter rhizosphaerae TaxID=1670831 RepID=A0A411YCH3_9ACTN|nr:radical SAM protein [Egibacter rhizosphaerae]QBI18914.1 radical SAM protein [Egibacter rhizosphaerae]
MRTLADLQRDPDEQPADADVLPIEVQRERTFETPEFAGMRFLEVETKSALNHVRGMPFEWSINPYRGCSHACSYCFARPTHEYLNLSPGTDFEKTVVVKTNIAEVLRRELARPNWRGAHVAMGTNTDNYQRAEGRYRLMPGIIDALGASRTPFSILTKGTLILRDRDALAEAAERVPVSAAFTVGMLGDRLWREAEPGTPDPRARLDAIARLNEAGIPTGMMLAPIMPGLNDDRDELAALVEAAAEAGARHITPIVLHLRPKVRAVFWPWLVATHPELVSRYRELYARGSEASPAYRRAVVGFVHERIRAARVRHGEPEPPPAWRGAESAAGEPDPGVQLSLL